MCTVYFNTPSDVVEGYKVVAIKDDKFYSSFTGQKFRVGRVSKPPKYCKKLSDYWALFNGVSLSARPFYNPSYIGYSSAFVEKADAQELLFRMTKFRAIEEDYTLIIVKVVFITALQGCYDIGYFKRNCPCIAGKLVTKIEVVDNNI